MTSPRQALFSRFATAVLFALSLTATTASQAGSNDLTIATTPLFLTTAVAPNVVMTLDDSGSMCWGFAPGATGYDSNNRGPFTTPSVVTGYGNALYYNPTTVYKPPERSDYPTKYTTSFDQAYVDGFAKTKGYVDLDSNYPSPTSSYCNSSMGTTSYQYTCNAAFGVTTKSCQAVFQPPTTTTTYVSCNDTDFVRNSYSSTCDVTYSTTGSGGGTRYFISATNCADTSIPPFQGLTSGSYVWVNGLRYTVNNNQPQPANGTTIIRVNQRVTPNTTPQRQTVVWGTGNNDTITCNDMTGWGGNRRSTSIFSGLTAGKQITVSSRYNSGTFTLASAPSNSSSTIEVTTHVTPDTGISATFGWSETTTTNTITVSGCGTNPFQGLTTGSSVTVSNTTSNNGTYTLTQAPTSNNTVLTVGSTLTSETASNAQFSWASGSSNSVTVSSCVDSNGDSSSSPFSSLSQNSTVTISGGTNDGNYTLSSNPTNNYSTLTVTPSFPTSGTYSGVTFSWSITTGGTSGVAAYYKVYYPDIKDISGVSVTNPNCSPLSRSNSNCYVTVNVGSANDIAYSGWGTAAASKQNFANWFSFYRTRALSVMSGATNAVTSFSDEEVRLAWQTINKCTTFSTCLSIDNTMRPLTATHRGDFYDWLEQFVPNGSTPLRAAMRRAGQYYTLSGLSGPYVKDPGHDDSAYSYDNTTTELTCRKNFQILFTDGYWNGTYSTTPSGNIDSTSITTLPDGTGSFTAPKSPYSDNNVTSLADIAFYYWATDLRSDLANNVPPYSPDSSLSDSYWNPKNDPATWQHMVTFTIGLGLSEAMGTDWGGNTYSGAYDSFLQGTKSWPATGSNSAGNVYDLWHAALNSRGQFFSVDSADSINAAFQSIVEAIREGTPSSASVATNSTSVQTNTTVYQATFDGNDWSGHLKAIQILSDGSIGSTLWDAATLLPNYTARNIYTINDSSGTGVAFTAAGCTGFSSTEQNYLSSCNTNLINYLRGDSTNEIRYQATNANAIYRNRSSTALGDIINSDPTYAYGEDYGYATASGLTSNEQNGYTAFLTQKTASGTVPVVYVGGNDGMLHAFNASPSATDGGGTELFAYVPAGIYDGLLSLSDPSYQHRFFVDGSPTVSDVYVAGDWKTYLVGGLNAGGKSIYALDVTNPSSFTASNVKWEYTDSADLGLTYSKPQIARLADGTWAAIFGNGYNSTNGHAILYIVNLATGQLKLKLDTYSLDTNTATDNGMSTPVVHTTGGVADTVYAGDLHGNLWKFDLSSSTASDWSNGIVRLFAATDSGGTPQPITSQPALYSNTAGGQLVYFGTGRYLTSTDPANMAVQSFYAIWDDPSGTPTGSTPEISRSNLQQQYIIDTSLQYGTYVRETTNTVTSYPSQKGWFIDLLPYTTSGTTLTAGTAEGERVRSTPIIKDGRVIFVTLIPNNDPCVSGGTSWLMELDALTGARPLVSAFDFNNDDTFDSSDNLSNGSTASGIKLSSLGIATTPTWITRDSKSAVKIMTGSSGSMTSVKNKSSSGSGGTGSSTGQRIYWEQLL